jgi:hypothetical protein
LKKQTFLNILDAKNKIQQVETAELKNVINKYPYFQTARTLYLKGLKKQDSFKYNKELKITAAYTTDRTILFNYITSKNFVLEKDNIHQEINTKISNEKVKEFSAIKKRNNPTESLKTISKELKIGAPISFQKSENFSFNQWLQLSIKKPIVREEKPVKIISKKTKIIEKFIKNNPKISPLSKDKKPYITISDNNQDSALMTETLAKVYLEQKKYENAIQAYRILSLKYPEKSGFFADQIKRVKNLQKHL